MRIFYIAIGGFVAGWLSYTAYSFCLGEPLCQLENGSLFDPIWFLYLSCLLPLTGISLSFLPGATIFDVKRAKSGLQTEQGYLIRTTRRIDVGRGYPIGDGYPMTVSYETLEKALTTGDYIYEGPATSNEAGDHYVNDGSGGSGSYVPGGQIVVEEPHYWDERLN